MQANRRAATTDGWKLNGDPRHIIFFAYINQMFLLTSTQQQLKFLNFPCTDSSSRRITFPNSTIDFHSMCVNKDD